MIIDLGSYENFTTKEQSIRLPLEVSNDNFKIIVNILLSNKEKLDSFLSPNASEIDLRDIFKSDLMSFDSKVLLNLLTTVDFLDIEILRNSIIKHWVDNFFQTQMTDINDITTDLKELIIKRIIPCKFLEIMWKDDNFVDVQHSIKEEETYQIALKIYYSKIVPSNMAKKTCMEIYVNHLIAQYILYDKNGNAWCFATGECCLPYCRETDTYVPYLVECKTKECCDKDYIVKLITPLFANEDYSEIISSLFDVLKNKKMYFTHERVFKLFASIGPISEKLNEVLTTALSHKETKIRFMAIQALRDIKPIEVQVSLVNGFFNHCYSHNCDFSKYALQELQKLDKLHYEVKVALVEAMKYSASYENARDILEKFITDPEVIQLLIKSLKNESSFLRRNAIKMLASLALDNKDIKEALSKNLKDKEAKARLAAIDFFLTVSPLKTQLPLIELLKESCFADRNQAYQRLLKFEKLDKKAKHALVKVAKHADAAYFASTLLKKFFPKSR
jgi:hypothetical protein